MTGTIFDIKEMAVHDGPGIRTTVFFKGCPLRCRWCHNPEGLTREPQVMFKQTRCRHCNACRVTCDHEECRALGRCLYRCPEGCMEVVGRQTEATALAEELLPGAQTLGQSFGGFTFSGGEPLLQTDFLVELADSLRPYHLCLQTCGYANADTFARAVEAVDLVLLDIKLADAEQHIRYTGVDNAPILRNYHYLKKTGKPHLIRTPLIPGITDTRENLEAIASLIGESPWERLDYNPLAGAKYPMLGMEFNL